jgi:NAD-dependent SIR2 family protein deacetylase
VYYLMMEPWYSFAIRLTDWLALISYASPLRQAKIPDFRGPNGVWTRRDRNQPAPKCTSETHWISIVSSFSTFEYIGYIFCEKSSPPLTGISMEAAMPTFTHRCLAKMQDEQKLAFLVSQNVDGCALRASALKLKIVYVL